MKRWKPCKEIPNYEVSNEGEVRNIKTGRVMKTSINQKGYETVCLHDKSKQYTRRVHRLVADAFNESSDSYLDVIHKDGDKSNNNINNLEYCNRSDIIKHTYLNGRKQLHRMKKVRCIETGEEFESIVECSKVTGINKSTISKCINNPYLSSREGYHFESIN